MAASTVLCPEIAHEQHVITPATMNALFLSSESRYVGAKVAITCLSRTTHKLVGSNLLTCTPSGQWDLPAPSCVPIVANNNESDVMIVTYDPSSREHGDYTMLPFVVAVTLLGATCVVLVALLAYMLRLLSKGRSKQKLTLDTSGSTSVDPRYYNTGSWVALTPSFDHVDRRDLAQSREVSAGESPRSKRNRRHHGHSRENSRSQSDRRELVAARDVTAVENLRPNSGEQDLALSRDALMIENPRYIYRQEWSVY